MQRREFISGFSASALLACAGTARAASSRRLVLLPAGGCDAGLYSDLNRALNDKARTKVIVTRGPSTEKAARDVLKNAPNGRFWLGGTSYGGAVALEVLKIAPERIAGLWLSGFFFHGEGKRSPKRNGEAHSGGTVRRSCSRDRRASFIAWRSRRARSSPHCTYDRSARRAHIGRTTRGNIKP